MDACPECHLLSPVPVEFDPSPRVTLTCAYRLDQDLTCPASGPGCRPTLPT